MFNLRQNITKLTLVTNEFLIDEYLIESLFNNFKFRVIEVNTFTAIL